MTSSLPLLQVPQSITGRHHTDDDLRALSVALRMANVETASAARLAGNRSLMFRVGDLVARVVKLSEFDAQELTRMLRFRQAGSALGIVHPPSTSFANLGVFRPSDSMVVILEPVIADSHILTSWQQVGQTLAEFHSKSSALSAGFAPVGMKLKFEHTVQVAQLLGQPEPLIAHITAIKEVAELKLADEGKNGTVLVHRDVTRENVLAGKMIDLDDLALGAAEHDLALLWRRMKLKSITTQQWEEFCMGYGTSPMKVALWPGLRYVVQAKDIEVLNRHCSKTLRKIDESDKALETSAALTEHFYTCAARVLEPRRTYGFAPLAPAPRVDLASTIGR